MSARRAVASLLFVVLSAPFLSAGDVPAVGENGGPVGPLSPAEMRQWLRGRALFDKDFHRADGVGTPELNADSCRACHQDPVLGGAGGLELNVSRFGSDNGGNGPFTNLLGGQGLSKLRPPWEEGRENYDPATADVFEQRQTPSVLGLGLIDGIPDAAILANQDPDDLDGDGIRGVPRMLLVDGNLELGRFGWKAQVPRLADFVRDAMGGENGITTPDDGRGFALLADDDDVEDPELSPSQVEDLAFFLEQLGPPIPPGPTDALALRGQEVFRTLRCDKCHVPELQGADGPVRLFSDLLLHDVMGPDYRGMAEDGAPSGSFRTPPLWGIGDTAPYMHDGRASTLEAAIEAHHGEAEACAVGFELAPTEQRQALISFLLGI
jgi:CxxC motif-containing protein (DUF1111 family)